MFKGLIKKMLFEGFRKMLSGVPIWGKGLALVGIIGLLVMFVTGLA